MPTQVRDSTTDRSQCTDWHRCTCWYLALQPVKSDVGLRPGSQMVMWISSHTRGGSQQQAGRFPHPSWVVEVCDRRGVEEDGFEKELVISDLSIYLCVINDALFIMCFLRRFAKQRACVHKWNWWLCFFPNIFLCEKKNKHSLWHTYSHEISSRILVPDSLAKVSCLVFSTKTSSQLNS